MSAFHDAFKGRRCIIPASGFYEWQKTGGKQPCAIVPEGDPLLAFAGLWENWFDRSAGDGAESRPASAITACSAGAGGVRNSIPSVRDVIQ